MSDTIDQLQTEFVAAAAEYDKASRAHKIAKRRRDNLADALGTACLRERGITPRVSVVRVGGAHARSGCVGVVTHCVAGLRACVVPLGDPTSRGHPRNNRQGRNRTLTCRIDDLILVEGRP